MSGIVLFCKTSDLLTAGDPTKLVESFKTTSNNHAQMHNRHDSGI